MHPEDDKPDWDLLGLGEDDDDAEEQVRRAHASHHARLTLGPEADVEGAIKPTARLIIQLLRVYPILEEGLRFEDSSGACRRRAQLVRAFAAYHDAAMNVRRHTGMLSIPATVMLFRALGYNDANAITDGIEALNRGCTRKEPIAPSAAVLQVLIVEVVRVLEQITEEELDFAFNPEAEYCDIYDGFGAEYIYRVLNASGFRCSREEIGDNIDEAIELMAEIDAFASWHNNDD